MPGMPGMPTTQAKSMSGDSSMMARMTGPLNISMTREGSGTSWLPDSSPMYAVHVTTGPWLLMFHGNVFLQYLDERGPRGDSQLGSINWLMGMARRPLGGGDLTLRLMMSGEPFTVGSCGYPDLLATGEACNGQPLHDRQHPHDLFMEVAAMYQHAVSKNLAVEIYGAPVGEPALGPTAYPHRISAISNPVAPISHHWLDATHISFGVITAGLYGRQWKLEGSLFNGREPDEFRYNFDFGPLDSYSGRLSYLPNDRWALQASIGRLTDAEPAIGGEPALSVTRPTVSATYHRPLGSQSIWASTLAWGSNIETGSTTHATLAETNVSLNNQNLVFARIEVTGKTGRDLALSDASMLTDRIFTVSKFALGYDRQFGPVMKLMPGIGVSGSLSVVPQSLVPFYGRRVQPGFGVFVSLRPAPMHMSEMGGHGMQDMRGTAAATPGTRSVPAARYSAAEM